MKPLFTRNRILPLVLIAGLAAYQYFAPAEKVLNVSAVSQAGVVEAAYAEQRSKVWVEIDGRVTRLLADDNEGDRHQRFILTLDSGHTVMIAHNIDLAKRVPLKKDDSLRVHGRYEWNDRGGVIHWTHHDPGNKRKGGWVELDGVVYR